MQPQRDYVQWDATSPVIIASSDQESPVRGDDLPVLREALEVRGVENRVGTTVRHQKNGRACGGNRIFICKQNGSLSQGIGVMGCLSNLREMWSSF